MKLPIEIEDNNLSLVDEIEDETIYDNSRSVLDLESYKFSSKGFKLQKGYCIRNKNVRQIIRRGLINTLYFLSEENYGFYFNSIKVFPFSELKEFAKGTHPAQYMQDEEIPKRQKRIKKIYE